MSKASPNPISPFSRPAVAAALVAVLAATFGASILLALSSSRVAPLHVAIVALSGAAFLLVAGAAWRVFRGRCELDRWITICAWTRRVHWQGRWVSFEEYLAQRFDLRCTHGICEEAAERIRNDATRFATDPLRIAALRRGAGAPGGFPAVERPGG